MLTVGLDQRPGYGVPHGSGLASLSATGHMRLHIERAQRVGGKNTTTAICNI